MNTRKSVQKKKSWMEDASGSAKRYSRNHLITEEDEDEQNILKSHGNLICSKYRNAALKIATTKKYDVAILDDGLQEKSLNYDNL